MEQKNIKDISSEELGLRMAEEYEKIGQSRNTILAVHAELNRRLTEKNQLEEETTHDE